MPENLYQHKYRIPSARLPGYDYAQDGFYFVTICTHDRRYYFGRVVGGVMVLNGVGRIVADEWFQTGVIRKNVVIDEWVVMPNHVHGILRIKKTSVGEPTFMENEPMFGSDKTSVGEPTFVKTPWQGVSTDVGDGPTTPNQITRQSEPNPQWKPGTIGVIINQFKRQCTIRIRRDFDPHFTWQTRFYDCIIWDDRALNKIRLYIENNPQKWELDKNRTGLWM